MRGMQVCASHCEALSTLVQRSEPGVCAVNLAERDRCCIVLHDDAKESIFCCNGLGCRVGFRRPCCVCGVGEELYVGGSEGSHQGSSDSNGGGANEGGEIRSDSDDGDGASHTSDAAEMPIPCPRAGCTAWAHGSCRQLLARRVCVWWDEDRTWYWGTAEVPPEEMRSDEVEIHYDDGTKEAEDLSGGADSPEFEWLVTPGSGGVACICRKSSYPENSAAKENSEQEDAMRACAICCTQAVLDGKEPGAVNDSEPAQRSNLGWSVLFVPTARHLPSNPAPNGSDLLRWVRRSRARILLRPGACTGGRARPTRPEGIQHPLQMRPVLSGQWYRRGGCVQALPKKNRADATSTFRWLGSPRVHHVQPGHQLWEAAAMPQLDFSLPAK